MLVLHRRYGHMTAIRMRNHDGLYRVVKQTRRTGHIFDLGGTYDIGILVTRIRIAHARKIKRHDVIMLGQKRCDKGEAPRMR